MADDATSATFAIGGAMEVRVTSRVDDDDGFDRILDGSFGRLSHDTAALAAPSSCHTISNEALTDGGFDTSGYTRIHWLVGGFRRTRFKGKAPTPLAT